MGRTHSGVRMIANSSEGGIIQKQNNFLIGQLLYRSQFKTYRTKFCIGLELKTGQNPANFNGHRIFFRLWRIFLISNRSQIHEKVIINHRYWMYTKTCNIVRYPPIFSLGCVKVRIEDYCF